MVEGEGWEQQMQPCLQYWLLPPHPTLENLGSASVWSQNSLSSGVAGVFILVDRVVLLRLISCLFFFQSQGSILYLFVCYIVEICGLEPITITGWISFVTER